MTPPKRPILKLAKAPAKIARPVLIVDYRVVWNEADTQWDILRNGVDTKASRRKKQSAIDLAIREAKAEMEKSQAKASVTTLDGRKVKTEWAGGAPKSAP